MFLDTCFQKYGLILVLILCFACQNKQASFPKTHSLTGHPVEDITVFSKGNVHLAVADTFLVVQKAAEPFIQIYGTNSHNLLAEFGTRGKGPGEFIGPSLQKQVNYDSSNGSPVIYIFDYKRQILSTVNILNLINAGEIEKQEQLPTNKFITFFHYKSDNTYIGSPGTDGRFFIYNYKTSQDTVIPYIPKTDFEIPASTLSAVYRSAVVVNAEKNVMAAAPLYLGELDFFNLNGKYLHSTIWTPREKFEEELSAGGGAFKNIKRQIADLDSKEGLIYGLNRNNSVIDGNNNELKNSIQVQVFNWNGEPIRKYSLDDGRRITYFAVDPIHNRIYAYDPNEEKHNIITYSMDKSNSD